MLLLKNIFDIEPGVRINGLHFHRENPKGLILYFHGNTRSIKAGPAMQKIFTGTIMM